MSRCKFQYLLVLIISILSFQFSTAQNSEKLDLSAHLMANVKSIFTNGSVKCEVVCYLETPLDSLPPLDFQIGWKEGEDPNYTSTVYIKSTCSADKDDVKITKVGDKYQINFGAITLEKNFKARLIVNAEMYSEVYPLELIGYGNKATKM